MKKTNLFLVAASLSASYFFLAENNCIASEPSFTQKKSDLLTSCHATSEAYCITAGDYVLFLNNNQAIVNQYALYSHDMKSQVVRTSDDDHNDYSLAEGVNPDDFMQGLTRSEIMAYAEWSGTNFEVEASPVMMFGEEEDPILKKADPREIATRGTKAAGAGGASSSSASQSTRSTDGIVAFSEAAAQAADHARENLRAEKMPGGDPSTRDSRIDGATESSAIADMLSSYVADSVAKKRATHDNTPLFAIHDAITTTPLQQAAAWEATVNESLLIARAALERVTNNHTDIQSKLTELQSAVSDSVHDAKEALDKRSDAVANVKAGALQAGGAAVGLAFGNPGPLVAEGVNLGVAVGGATLAHLDVRKTAAEVAEATASLEYTNAKVGILAKIKDRAEALHTALMPLQIEATRFFEELAESTRSIATKEKILSKHRETAEEEASTLRTIHAQNLIAWATDKLIEAESAKNNNEQLVAQKQEAFNQAEHNYKKAPFGGAEKELNVKTEAEAELKKAQTNLGRSERAIKSVEHYKTQAEGILEALQSRNDWAEIKTEALNELEQARRDKTSLESALHAAAEEYGKIKAEWKATSNVNSVLYPQKKLNKDAAKLKRTKCETDVEQAALALAQAETVAQSATQDLASIDARLSIWDNLRAWHTATLSQNKMLEVAPLRLEHRQNIMKPTFTSVEEKAAQLIQAVQIAPEDQPLQSESLKKAAEVNNEARQPEILTEQPAEPLQREKKAAQINSDIESSAIDSSVPDAHEIEKDAQDAIELVHRVDVAEKVTEETTFKLTAYKAQKAGLAVPVAMNSIKTPEHEMDEVAQDARNDIELGHRIDVADKKQEQMKQKLAAYRAAKVAKQANSNMGSAITESEGNLITSSVPAVNPAPDEALDDTIPDVNKDAQDAIEIGHQIDVATKTRQVAQDKIAAYRAKKAGLSASQSAEEKRVTVTAEGTIAAENQTALPASEIADDILVDVNKDAQNAIETSHQIDVAAKTRKAMEDKLAAYKAKKNKK